MIGRFQVFGVNRPIRCLIRLIIGWVSLTALSLGAAAAEVQYAREVTFEATFAHSDLAWLGDVASPVAMAYPKAGAQPTATDIQVRTVSTRHDSPIRRHLREARIAAGSPRTVFAFTSQAERAVGQINAQGQFTANEFFAAQHGLLPSWPSDGTVLKYDAAENALYYELNVSGPTTAESLDYLPLALFDGTGTPVAGRFSLEFRPPRQDEPGRLALALTRGAGRDILATCALPAAFPREAAMLGSFDNQQGAYLPESVYRAGGKPNAAASVTFSFPGQFTDLVRSDGPRLTLANGKADAKAAIAQKNAPTERPSGIAIDGAFEDWRNVPGVDDPRGEVMPYLEYVPDVDLLEFKIAHDDEHIYFYARVAGQVGRTHPDGGRSYFYAYMDIDQNPETGFLPSRDDDCYFGVDIGDDCEVQFEFVNNAFRKSFYGFCGLGGDKQVLDGAVTLGKSQYGRLDERGQERAHYKSEYIYRDGKTEITEDLKLGTSDTIRLAVSPDGREVEVSSQLSGFLHDSDGRSTLRSGQTIDVAAGMESDSKLYLGKTRWGADSTPAIRGYRLNATN